MRGFMPISSLTSSNTNQLMPAAGATLTRLGRMPCAQPRPCVSCPSVSSYIKQQMLAAVATLNRLGRRPLRNPALKQIVHISRYIHIGSCHSQAPL